MPDDKYEIIQVERENKLLTATLNRPENLNAFNPTLHHELEMFFGEGAHDNEENAILRTGAGRAFSACGDVKGIA